MVQAFGYTLNKSDGGHLRGALSFGGSINCIPHRCPLTIDRAANSSTLNGLLMSAFRPLAALFGSIPATLAPKEFVSPSFVHLALGPCKVPPNLGQAFAKRPLEFAPLESFKMIRPRLTFPGSAHPDAEIFFGPKGWSWMALAFAAVRLDLSIK